jgi:dolichyl-phosphate-mannose-protein mannosyltransferase
MTSPASFARSRIPALGVLLAAGLALRLGLAYVVFPGAGFSTDLGLFQSWATTLASTGPGTFYASAGTANYPPGYLWVLWALGSVGNAIGGLIGTSGATVTASLLKLPAIAADLGIAVLAARTAGRWFGGRAGLLAAGLYLFVPVTWYDSALWGQVDAVGAFVALGAALLLLGGWSELALAAAVVATLVKPQDAIVLAIVVPVLLRRHLLRIGSGPIPAFGMRLATLDRHLGGGLGSIVREQGPRRLLTSAILAFVVGLMVLVPFDIQSFAPASLADLPVIGQVVGLVGLFAQVGGEFSVLTANAYNAWALVGSAPLASAIGAGGGSWTADSTVILGGLTAVTIGAGLLASIGLLVSGGLLIRDGRLPILLGLGVLAFAFYAVPTRVHERYLVPFFAVGAILAAGSLARTATFVAAAFLNAINLHAVLGAPLQIGRGLGGGFGSNGFGGAPSGGGGLGRNSGPGAGPPTDGGGFTSSFTSIQLPFAELVRSQVVVEIVAVGQTLVMLGLLAAWVVVLVRPSERATARPRLPVSTAPSHS